VGFSLGLFFAKALGKPISKKMKILRKYSFYLIALMKKNPTSGS
jgi:hypothetical protein